MHPHMPTFPRPGARAFSGLSRIRHPSRRVTGGPTGGGTQVLAALPRHVTHPEAAPKDLAIDLDEEEEPSTQVVKALSRMTDGMAWLGIVRLCVARVRWVLTFC